MAEAQVIEPSASGVERARASGRVALLAVALLIVLPWIAADKFVLHILSLIAIASIILVSQQGGAASDAGTPTSRVSGLGLALAAGIAIGLFFLSLARTSAEAGLWPMLAARMASTTLFAVVSIVRRQSIRMPLPVAATVIFGGAVDMLANVLYLVASRLGPLSVVVTLSSLYPASTVVLARVVLGERLSAQQAVGIVLALAAVVLIVGAG